MPPPCPSFFSRTMIIRVAVVPLRNQSGHSTNTFYTVSAGVFLSSCNLVDAHSWNVDIYHQPSVGPTVTGLMSAGRFQPYERFRARSSEHRNAEGHRPWCLRMSGAPVTQHNNPPDG